MRLLIIFILGPLMAFSSNIDSLDRLISKSSGVRKNELLALKYKQLGDTANKYYKYDSAISYLMLAIAYADSAKDIELLARCYNNIGTSYEEKDQFSVSFKYYKKSLEIWQELGDSGELARAFYNLGRTYKNLGRTDTAVILLIEAERLCLFLNKEPLLASIFNTFGVLYKDLYELDEDMVTLNKARIYHLRALGIRIRLDDKKKLSSTYNNLGNVYKLLGENDSALNYFQKSLQIKLTNNNLDALANTYSNIGEIYLVTNKMAYAEEYFKKAREIRVRDNIQEGTIYSLVDFARLDTARGNYKSAVSGALKGVGIAKNIKAVSLEIELYKLLISVFKRTKSYSKALEYSDKYIEALKTANSIEMQKQREELSISFETEKKEQQIENLSQEDKINKTALKLQDEQLKLQSIVNSSLVIGVVILLILIGLVYYAFQLKRNLAEQQETHMRELHHRVKNNLQILSGLLSLQSDQLIDPEAKEAVKSGENRVKAMVLIHQKLYHETDVTSVNMKAYITDLVSYLSDAYGFSESTLALKYDIQDLDLDVDKAIPLGLILNELVSNAFKYAFTLNDNPTLTIRFYKKEPDTYYLVVKDNGKTIPHQQTQNSFGLNLVNTQCRQLKAKMQVEKNDGWSYTIII